MIITLERPGEQPCWSEPWTRFSARTGQCREPQPVARLVADPADLAAQDRVLVPEYQEFGILGHLTPSLHLEAGEQTACDQVDARGDRSGMISARKPGQARSNNRAPQVRCHHDGAVTYQLNKHTGGSARTRPPRFRHPPANPHNCALGPVWRHARSCCVEVRRTWVIYGKLGHEGLRDLHQVGTPPPPAGCGSAPGCDRGVKLTVMDPHKYPPYLYRVMPQGGSAWGIAAPRAALWAWLRWLPAPDSCRACDRAGGSRTGRKPGRRSRRR